MYEGESPLKNLVILVLVWDIFLITKRENS